MLDYLFVYEHKARELESVCLLKAVLELRGYSCEIIQLHNFSFKTLNFRYFNKPKVIIVFALYNNKSFVGHVIDFVGYSKKVVNLQWEQIISDKYIKLGLHNPKGLAALATHICWGENSFKRLINNGVKNAVITGAIHLDFLRNDFRDFYKTREELCEEFNIDGTKKIILYISSFTFATMSATEKLSTEKLLGGCCDDIVSLAKESRMTTLSIFEKLLQSDRGKDICIIYRPHPGENIDDRLSNMSNKYQNFRTIGSYSIKQWILSADEIITWFSTSIAEVYYAGKSCHVLRPYPISETIDVTAFKGVKSIGTYEEVYSLIKHDSNQEFPISPDVLKDYYDFSINVPSYKRIINLLTEVYKTDKYDINYLSQKNKYFFNVIKKMIKLIIIKYKIQFKVWPFCKMKSIKSVLDKHWFYYAKRQNDIVSQKEILSMVNKMKAIIQRDKEID